MNDQKSPAREGSSDQTMVQELAPVTGLVTALEKRKTGSMRTAERSQVSEVTTLAMAGVRRPGAVIV